MNKAARKRLEALCDPATTTLEAALLEEVMVKCQSCGKKTPAKMPKAVSVRAATAILDRGGLGPKATMVHERGQSEEDELQGLLYELREMSYSERLIVAQSILPELEGELRAAGSKPLLTAGEGLEVATPSLASASGPGTPKPHQDTGAESRSLRDSTTDT